jgi:glycine/D-amino acid oxidase-like deaminating enzyme
MGPVGPRRVIDSEAVMTRVIGFNPFRRSRTLYSGKSRASPIDDGSALPRETDVVIVGGGLAGVLTALYLVEAGLRVTICDKGRVAGEQSSRAMGWVASLGDDPKRLTLSAASKNLWNSYHSLLGIDTTYRRTGVTILCYSEKELADLEAWRVKAADQGRTDAQVLSRNELSKRLPELEYTGAIAAMYQRSDGCIEPDIATSRIANALQRRGVTILENCAVRAIESSAGRISHVVTENGSVRTNTVVIAAGAWSRMFLQHLGVDLPQLTMYGSVFRTNPIASGLAGCGATKDFGWRRHIDGSYSFGNNSAIASIVPDSFRLLKQFLPAFREGHASVSIDFDRDFFDNLLRPKHWPADRPGPFERNRILTSTPDMKLAMTILRDVAQTFPDFRNAKLAEAWGAVIDVTPDRAPIVSEIDPIKGLYVCTGFSAHGLAMAPAAGKLVASLISGQSPDVNPAEFALNRFTRRKAIA